MLIQKVVQMVIEFVTERKVFKSLMDERHFSQIVSRSIRPRVNALAVVRS